MSWNWALIQPRNYFGRELPVHHGRWKTHREVVTKVYKTIDIIADMSSNYVSLMTCQQCTRLTTLKTQVPRQWLRIREWMSIAPKDEASDEDKAIFLTVLIHGVVMIDGREDLTQDLLMNVSRPPPNIWFFLWFFCRRVPTISWR